MNVSDLAVRESVWSRGLRSRTIALHAVDRWSLTVGAALLAGLVVSVWGISQYPIPFDDEGTYMAEAWAVLTNGELSHYTYWYDHPPLGWLMIVPWMLLTGGYDSESILLAGRLLMVLASTGASFFVYVIARRLGMRRPFALMALLLFAFSPLSMNFHRMVLLDNLAVVVFLVSILLLLSPRRRMWSQQAGVIVFGLSVLTKETMLLLAPVVLLLLWQETSKHNRRYSLALGTSLLFSVLLFYPLLAALKGELLPGAGHVSLVGAIRWQLFDRPSGGSVFDMTSTTFDTVNTWMNLDSWLPALGLLALPASLVVSRLRPFAVGVMVMVIALTRPGYLPYMFVVAALPLLALMVAGVMDLIWAGRKGRHSNLHFNKLERKTRPMILATVLPIVLLGLIPQWGSGLWTQATLDVAKPFEQAEAWIVENVPPGTPILVDNILWMELVAKGYPPEQTVWYYKLDLDPSVAARFPNGWQDFEYLVSSPVLRSTVDFLPNVEEALANSHVVSTFTPSDIEGEGVRIDIRAIDFPSR